MWCQEAAAENRRLSRELLELKTKLGVKDASLARLKDAITQQYVEKEDILQLKIKSETELRACERQVSSTFIELIVGRPGRVLIQPNFFTCSCAYEKLGEMRQAPRLLGEGSLQIIIRLLKKKDRILNFDRFSDLIQPFLHEIVFIFASYLMVVCLRGRVTVRSDR